MESISLSKGLATTISGFQQSFYSVDYKLFMIEQEVPYVY